MTDQERMARPLSVDPDIYEAVQHEVERQHSRAGVDREREFHFRSRLEATGSVFTNKYAEGYPGKRYYGGCEFTDIVENLACDRAMKLFPCRACERLSAFRVAGESGGLYQLYSSPATLSWG